jgi:hypothetical protein
MSGMVERVEEALRVDRLRADRERLLVAAKAFVACNYADPKDPFLIKLKAAITAAEEPKK